jgi:DNA-binding CsgD family transcriptional regulator
VKKQFIIYGLLFGLLIVALKIIEYNFVIKDYAIELYGGILALLFTVLGIWLGLKLVQPKKEIVTVERIVEVPIIPSTSETFEMNTLELEKLRISKREHEVLILIAKGMSNQEIADNLFVSLNTVKTHSSRLFEKLDVNRRVQAVEKAKALKIIS